jgi:type II secretory pathway component PulF
VTALLCLAVGVYLGGFVAVLPILREAQDEYGRQMPWPTCTRLALCWPLHPWKSA